MLPNGRGGYPVANENCDLQRVEHKKGKRLVWCDAHVKRVMDGLDGEKCYKTFPQPCHLFEREGECELRKEKEQASG